MFCIQLQVYFLAPFIDSEYFFRSQLKIPGFIYYTVLM